MKEKPLNMDQESIIRYTGVREESNQSSSIINRVMLNMFDSGRTFDLDPRSQYNT